MWSCWRSDRWTLCDLGVGGGAGVGSRGLGACFLAGPDLLGALSRLFIERGFLARGVTHVNSYGSCGPAPAAPVLLVTYVRRRARAITAAELG